MQMAKGMFRKGPPFAESTIDQTKAHLSKKGDVLRRIEDTILVHAIDIDVRNRLASMSLPAVRLTHP